MEAMSGWTGREGCYILESRISVEFRCGMNDWTQMNGRQNHAAQAGER
jgi:hypothetical protein